LAGFPSLTASLVLHFFPADFPPAPMPNRGRNQLPYVVQECAISIGTMSFLAAFIPGQPLVAWHLAKGYLLSTEKILWPTLITNTVSLGSVRHGNSLPSML
jgi:hypothetical protein